MIYLTLESYKPSGPDGRGMTRLRVDSMPASPRCALKPSCWGTLRESWNTQMAKWNGGFGCCQGTGECKSCPTFNLPPTQLTCFADSVLVRIDESNRLHVMDKPEKGWASWGEFWTWEEMARLEGWNLGSRYSDEHSNGFWLHRCQ